MRKLEVANKWLKDDKHATIVALSPCRRKTAKKTLRPVGIVQSASSTCTTSLNAKMRLLIYIKKSPELAPLKK